MFQRGIYPPDQFSQVPKYGLTMLITNDTALQDYLGNITKMIRSKSLALLSCTAARVGHTHRQTLATIRRLVDGARSPEGRCRREQREHW